MIKNPLVIHSVKKYGANVNFPNRSVQVDSILLGAEEELMSRVNELIDTVQRKRIKTSEGE